MEKNSKKIKIINKNVINKRIEWLSIGFKTFSFSNINSVKLIVFFFIHIFENKKTIRGSDIKKIYLRVSFIGLYPSFTNIPLASIVLFKGKDILSHKRVATIMEIMTEKKI